MDENELGVVVAVGPEGVGDGTLDFAAAEAARRGTGIELLHVVHAAAASPPPVGQIQSLDRALLEVGHRVLTDAAEGVRARQRAAVPLGTELVTGPVAATIAARAGTRSLVVLERREREGLGRLLTMSVSTRVAAHTRVPVAVVPSGWAGDAADRPVTVGVDSAADPVGQAETAAAYAAESGRELAVLHALWLAEPYQDQAFVTHTRKQWMREADSGLRDELAKLAGTGAEISHHVRWERPVDALVAASRHSSLLVVSRRPEHGRPGAHLGPVIRAVLRHAACPVLVVDRS